MWVRLQPDDDHLIAIEVNTLRINRARVRWFGEQHGGELQLSHNDAGCAAVTLRLPWKQTDG